MAEAKNENGKPFDPFESFKGMRDAYLDAMSKTMIEAVNTESYAKASGVMLDYCLSASAPFRDALEKSMVQVLQQLSLPSKQEVAVLAERFTNVEMRLDDLDAKLDRVLNVISEIKQEQAQRQPERTPPSPRKRR